MSKPGDPATSHQALCCLHLKGKCLLALRCPLLSSSLHFPIRVLQLWKPLSSKWRDLLVLPPPPNLCLQSTEACFLPSASSTFPPPPPPPSSHLYPHYSVPQVIPHSQSTTIEAQKFGPILDMLFESLMLSFLFLPLLRHDRHHHC